MKILYIHQYFHTPSEPGGTRSYWISRELIRRGHDVVMVTSTNKFHPQPGVEMVEGIKVIYIKNEYSNYMSKLQKVKSFCSFLNKAIGEAKKEDNVDIVYATSTPLTVGAVAMRLKSAKGWPYVFEVRDLWPEFPIQIGAIRNKFIIGILRKLEKDIYQKANHIVALSPGMRDGVVAAGIPADKVSMIPNMSKPDEFYPRPHNHKIAEEFGVDLSKFNIIHFGSMGVANGLDYILNTAEICQHMDINDVEFLFLGDGATLPELQKMSEGKNLRNVKFLGNHEMKTVSEIVNLCDLSITSFKNLPILQTNSPNKLFDSLSAGKPIVVNSAGWTKDLVEKENCGFFVNPDSPQDFVDKIKLYKGNTEILKTWAENARNLSESVYDKSILSRQVAEVIERHYTNESD
ncbi:MAG: glycosyltransferase family 4 protein [Bacteroides sp.]|nr:glycosyltransferase family 4 protein [Bacteroides sp.]